MRHPNPLPLLLLLACSVPFAPLARDWMGVKRPQRTDTASGDSAFMAGSSLSTPKSRPKAETSWVSRKVRSLPVGSPGTFLGTLEGVRCFNCEPGIVHLNLGDTLSREAGFLSLRLEIWNSIDRPVRDRRMFDYANQCFYFGYKTVDTVWVGGESAEIRVQEVPCYPYLQRRVTPHTPMGAALPAPKTVPAPVPQPNGAESVPKPPDPQAPAAPAPSPAPTPMEDSARKPVPSPPLAP